MNFNYILGTGGSYIHESAQTILVKNKRSVINDGEIVDSSSVVTGSYSILLSANSQTLHEVEATKETVNSEDYYYSDSGDFYTYIKNGGSISVIKDSSFDKDDLFYFDTKKSKQKIQVTKPEGESWLGDTLPNLTQDIQPISTGEFFSGWDVFLNGQKVPEIDGGLLDGISGVAFAIEKDDGIWETDGSIEDVFGVKYIPKQVDLYLNGLSQPDSLYMELYTGISLVETGKSSSVNIKESFKDQLFF